MTTQKLSFAVNDIRLEEEIDKSQFAVLSVDAFATGRSAHDTFVSEETLKRTSKTILQKPFVFVVDKRFNDIGSHDKKEVAAGFVPHNSPITFKTLDDGRIMMSCQVLIWKRYSGQLLEFFERDGRKKGVSVEIEVFESREDPKSGLLELLDYCFDAITCLGDLIRPAIPNAEAVLQFSVEFEEAKKQYELEFGKYEDADFSIPKKVKRAAQLALENYEENGGIVSPAHLAMARYLAREEKITPEKLRAMSKYFNRKNLDESDISYGMYGAGDGARWSKEMCDFMDKSDSERVSYFNQESSFEDESNKEEEKTMARKKNDEAKVEEPEVIEMAESEEEKTEQPAEEPKEEPKEEEMAAPEEKPESEEKSEDEKPKEEMAAPAEEEKPEEKEEEFSFGFDPAMAMSLMTGNTECESEFAKGKDANFSVIANSMFAAMCKMAEDCKAHMAEMATLREFKATREEAEKKFAVDLTLKEATEKYVISDDDLNKMREEGYAFEFASLDDWKTSVKAKCFDFAVINNKDKGTNDIKRIGMPFPAGTGFATTNSPWPANKQ